MGKELAFRDPSTRLSLLRGLSQRLDERLELMRMQDLNEISEEIDSLGDATPLRSNRTPAARAIRGRKPSDNSHGRLRKFKTVTYIQGSDCD